MATIFSSHAVYIESTDFYHDLSFIRAKGKLKVLEKILIYPQFPSYDKITIHITKPPTAFKYRKYRVLAR